MADGRGSEESGTSRGTDFKYKGGADPEPFEKKPSFKSASWQKLVDRDSSGGTLPLYSLAAETDERCKSMVLPKQSGGSSKDGGSFKDGGSSKDGESSKDGAGMNDVGSEGSKSPAAPKFRSKSISIADFMYSSRVRKVLPVDGNASVSRAEC